MTTKMNQTLLLGMVLTLLFVFSTVSANAQGFNNNHKPSPAQAVHPQPQQPIFQHQQPQQNHSMPQPKLQHHQLPYQPQPLYQPSMTFKPVQNHCQPTPIIHPVSVVQPPQVIVVGQQPKPTLLGKIISLFR